MDEGGDSWKAVMMTVGTRARRSRAEGAVAGCLLIMINVQEGGRPFIIITTTTTQWYPCIHTTGLGEEAWQCQP